MLLNEREVLLFTDRVEMAPDPHGISGLAVLIGTQHFRFGQLSSDVVNLLQHIDSNRNVGTAFDEAPAVVAALWLIFVTWNVPPVEIVPMPSESLPNRGGLPDHAANSFSISARCAFVSVF